MRRSLFSDEQITTIVKEHEVGGGTAVLCRRHGISEQTLCCWKAKLGGPHGREARQSRALEEENGRPKWPVADQALGNQVFKELLYLPAVSHPRRRSESRGVPTSDAGDRPRQCGGNHFRVGPR